MRGKLTFPDEAALAAWQLVQIDPFDYDFIELFPSRETEGEFVVGEVLAELSDLTVDIDGPEITISGNLPDTYYMSGHLEAHQLCAMFWAAAEHGGRGALLVFNIDDENDHHWGCCAIRVEKEPREGYFGERKGKKLMKVWGVI